MKHTMTRRAMLRNTALAGVGAWILADGQTLGASSPNEKLDVAVVGIGGRGRANLNAVAGENLVALCDVDDQRAGDAYAKYSQAKRFRDYRKMLDEVGGSIDAVVISTPDHTHFHPAWSAMQLGKHCYLEKPMAHSVWEVRALTNLAAEKKLVTQLGVQRHALQNVHRVVELVQSGAIGTVTEVHAWVGGDRGMPGMPKDFPPVPKHLDWDLWLGPATERPYTPAYCPYNWRFWWDFGTGETGNWGCHVLDLPFWALGLDYPDHVEASGPERHDQMTPKQLASKLRFPAKGSRPEVTLHWYHSKSGPDILRENDMPHYGTGVVFVGSKGKLLCDFGKRELFPKKDFEGFEAPPKSIPDSPGFHREWINACKGDSTPPTCHFGYSGPMTETVLLANVAYRVGEGFAWDAAKLEAPGRPDVAARIRPPFRKGWEVIGA